MYKNLEHENDTKSIFKTTKNLLNWKSGGSPQSFLIDGRLYRRPVELANLQLDYFIQKVDKLTSRFRNNNTNPLRWLIPAMNKWEGKGTFPKFIFEELTLEKVSQLISDLGNSSSMGTDSIDARALKDATSILAPPIKHIINVSLRTSTYANCWKLSKLVPLLKSKDLNKLSPSAYRPIAILPALSKIVEKAAQTQLLNYFKNKQTFERLHPCISQRIQHHHHATGHHGQAIQSH